MTREEAIKCIKIHMHIHRMAEDRAVYITEALNMAIEALEAQEWIPCDRGKPDPYERVLMTERRPDWNGEEYYFVTLDSFCNHRGDVVAWMPSPKPYT